ncbi:phenylacetic acid degradation protein [beta proteobacterium AAP121]|nr:phenylacetic acid degradation protein [beta proteobacterium AAP65]KPF97998.1 phenylacetic acid degradation protein [beta proteobacterium AAP121]
MNAATATPLRLHLTTELQYVLRLADTALVHAQRLSEWCGHAPVLEEDIALTNMALDLLGQARALLTHAAMLEGQGLDEDTLAYWREHDQFFNLTLVEQPLRKPGAHAPGGDFADTVLRNFVLASWLKAAWAALQASHDATLAGIAAKSLKEARYHQQHNADWVQRLGDGTDESARRMAAAVQRLWPYTAEMFEHDAVDEAARTSGLGPARADLRTAWLGDVAEVFAAAGLTLPADTPFRSTGTQGRHSEHLGYLLAEMQVLQRQHPGGRW